VGKSVKLFFLLVRRVPPVPSPVLVEVSALLRKRGFEVDGGIAEEIVVRSDCFQPAHDLYLLKSHTELSLSLAGVLDAQGAALLNPYLSCVATQNKIVASRRLRAAGVPVPRTWVTGNVDLLRSIAEGSPLIVKPYRGHRGAGIHLVRTPTDLRDVSSAGGTIMAQEYVDGGPEDVKVYVVGDEVFAVRKPFSETSFTVAGRPCRVDAELREIALRCGRALGLGLYGLDIAETPDGPVVVDLNYFPGYKGVPGIAPLIADYIERYASGEETLELPPVDTVDEAVPLE
jgi:ribosomal protein S6--L-glutamate ligase